MSADAHQLGGPATETKHAYATMKDANNGPMLPPPATHTPHRRRRIVLTCCCLFLLFLFTLGLTVLVNWLILRPKAGNYTLAGATLNVFNLTHTSTQYSLDADINLLIRFNNPNTNMGFNIEGINLQALHTREKIGQVALPPFHQACRNDTTLLARVRVAKHVVSETVGGEMESEVARSNITLQVVMNAKVRSDEGWYASLHPYRGVHLTCLVHLTAPGINGTSAPGVVIGKSCSVNRDSAH